jgi:DNA (cytosine-5)-methyltransferase 1
MQGSKLKCFDVCCGAGIFSLGFHRVGFEVVGGIDIDPHAIKTVEANFRSANWKVQSLQSLQEELEHNHKHPIFEVDVLLAGLPCQGFSIAGKCDPYDARNTLYRHLLPIIESVRPEFVVSENVQGLLAERNAHVFSSFINGLRELEYDVDSRLYDAVNFGTPQFRKRVIIIASRKVPARIVFENVNFSTSHVTVKDALAGLSSRKQEPSMNHTFMAHSKKVKNKIRRIKDARVISYRRLQADRPSLTITSGHNALPLHPTATRAISNREAARLQGVPDHFLFFGPRTNQTVQVANAVPLPMVEAIARSLRVATERTKAVQGVLYCHLLVRSTKRTKSILRRGFIRHFTVGGLKFPWRRLTNPHKTLLTEILLQRTRGTMVNGVWNDFMSATRTSDGKILVDPNRLRRVFRKIGIFKRAHAIVLLSAALNERFQGKIPRSFEELRSLPGVGIYISSAVRTFAFGIPDFPVDSNAFRFVSRYFGAKNGATKREALQIREFMNEIISKKKPKEFVYGFLDFSSTICTPVNPKCNKCFLRNNCEYAASK